jgi:hypothetical protein
MISSGLRIYRIRILASIVLQFALCIVAFAAQDRPISNPGQQEKPPEPEKHEKVPGSDKKIRILVLVDASAPLLVDFETSVRMARHATPGLMPGLLNLAISSLFDAAISSRQRSKESQRLQETVGEFERKPLIENSIIAAFGSFTPYFEAVAPKDPAIYRNPNVDFDKVRADGYPYVLTVTEVGGMSTAWELKTLSAASSFRFDLYDAATRKRIGMGNSSVFASSRHAFDPATTDRTIFTGDYPTAAGQAGFRIYGELNRQGDLHTMAAANGLGSEVPSLDAILERYAGAFHYNPQLPAGWRRVNTKSKLVVTLEPKSRDRTHIGVVFAADLLVKELGQDVKELDEYVSMYFGRLKDGGYDVDSAQPFDGFKLNEGYRSFIMDRPNGAGKEIFSFQILPDHFVAIYDTVMLPGFEDYLKRYTSDIESLINNSQITTSAETQGTK